MRKCLKQFSILLIYLFATFFVAFARDSNLTRFNIKKYPTSKLDAYVYEPADWIKPFVAEYPEFKLELWFYDYSIIKDPKFFEGRIFFYCRDDDYEFNDVYAITWHVLEEFCIEKGFVRPVYRRNPEEHFFKNPNDSNVVWVKYQAFIAFQRY